MLFGGMYSNMNVLKYVLKFVVRGKKPNLKFLVYTINKNQSIYNI